VGSGCGGAGRRSWPVEKARAAARVCFHTLSDVFLVASREDGGCNQARFFWSSLPALSVRAVWRAAARRVGSSINSSNPSARHNRPAAVVVGQACSYGLQPSPSVVVNVGEPSAQSRSTDHQPSKSHTVIGLRLVILICAHLAPPSLTPAH